MQMTLLDIVKSVLSDTNGSEVNSISDTTESLKISNYAKDIYYQMVSVYGNPEFKKLFKLTASGDSSKPTHMIVPSEVDTLEIVCYNTSLEGDTEFSTMMYVDPISFIKRSDSLRATESNVEEVTDYSGVTLRVYNDRMPSCYTSFDDSHLVFDAYDSSVDSTLQESKTEAYGVVRNSWQETDTYTPNLDSNLFPEYLLRVKQAAFMFDRQEQSPVIELGLREQKINNRKRTSKTPRTNLLMTYERK